MLDDRSFSSQSYDARSWLAVLVAAAVRYARQLFVRSSTDETVILSEQEDVKVTKNVR
jgi:hypothetical protein